MIYRNMALTSLGNDVSASNNEYGPSEFLLKVLNNVLAHLAERLKGSEWDLHNNGLAD